MATRSVIIVDVSLTESVEEYAAIVGALAPEQEFSSTIQSYVDEEINEDALSEAILKSVQVLGGLQDKEFEPSVNLIIHILSSLKNSDLESNLSVLVKNLVALNPSQQPAFRDKKSLKTSSIISSITNIFNYINADSQLRIDILKSLIGLSKSLGFSVIKPIGPNLILWLTQANATNEQVSSIFWEFIFIDNSFSEESLKIIKSYSSEIEVSLKDLHNIIRFSLSSSIVDLAFLLNKNIEIAIAKNSSDELVKLFSGYINGNISTFKSISDSTFETNGLDKHSIQAKIQILALAVLVSSRDSITYEEIAKELSISKGEVEQLLISSIANNVLQGRLNQLNETFAVHRVNQIGSVNTKENWLKIKSCLESWKANLKDIQEIVEVSKQKSLNNFATAN